MKVNGSGWLFVTFTYHLQLAKDIMKNCQGKIMKVKTSLKETREVCQCLVFEEILGVGYNIETTVCAICNELTKKTYLLNFLNELVILKNDVMSLEKAIDIIVKNVSKEEAQKSLLLAARSGKYDRERILIISKNLREK